MDKSQEEQIVNKIIEILENSYQPVNRVELLRKVARELPDVKKRHIPRVFLFLLTTRCDIVEIDKDFFILEKYSQGYSDKREPLYRRVANRIIEILESSPEGIRRPQVLEKIRLEFPEFKKHDFKDITTFIRKVRKDFMFIPPNTYVLSKYKDNVFENLSKRSKIAVIARQILENRPNGITIKEFLNEMQKYFPDTSETAIRGAFKEVKKKHPEFVCPKPGFLILDKYLGNATLPENINDRVYKAVIETLKDYPEGLKLADLISLVTRKFFPEQVEANMRAFIKRILKYPNIEKISKGRYRVNFQMQTELKETNGLLLYNLSKNEKSKIEFEICNSFANFLVNNLKEASKTWVFYEHKYDDGIFLPEVLGINPFDFQNFDPRDVEITSACASLDIVDIPFILGKAMGYKIFSHRVYIVLPDRIEKFEDKMKLLENFCMKFGIGLVYFNISRRSEFFVRIKAVRIMPEPYFVNEYILSLPFLLKEQQ